MKTKGLISAFPAKDRKLLSKRAVRRAVKWLKRAANRADRRRAKLDPEGALVKRRYRGWWV